MRRSRRRVPSFRIASDGLWRGDPEDGSNRCSEQINKERPSRSDTDHAFNHASQEEIDQVADDLGRHDRHCQPPRPETSLEPPDASGVERNCDDEQSEPGYAAERRELRMSARIQRPDVIQCGPWPHQGDSGERSRPCSPQQKDAKSRDAAGTSRNLVSGIHVLNIN